MDGGEESTEEVDEEANGQSGVEESAGQATRKIDAAEKPIDRTATRHDGPVHETSTRIEAEIKTDGPVKIESAKIRQMTDDGNSDIHMSPPVVAVSSDIHMSPDDNVENDPVFQEFMATMDELMTTTEANRAGKSRSRGGSRRKFTPSQAMVRRLSEPANSRRSPLGRRTNYGTVPARNFVQRSVSMRHARSWVTDLRT